MFRTLKINMTAVRLSEDSWCLIGNQIHRNRQDIHDHRVVWVKAVAGVDRSGPTRAGLVRYKNYTHRIEDSYGTVPTLGTVMPVQVHSSGPLPANQGQPLA